MPKLSQSHQEDAPTPDWLLDNLNQPMIASANSLGHQPSKLQQLASTIFPVKARWMTRLEGDLRSRIGSLLFTLLTRIE